MKDSYYFPHDSNAQYDDKMTVLRMSFGWEGYGLFWAVIEKLRNARDYTWPAKSRASLEHCLTDASTSLERVKQIMDLIFQIQLLVIKNDKILSPALSERMKVFDLKRQKLIEAGRLGGIASHKASLEHRLSDPQAVKESKVKGSKENKRKEITALCESPQAEIHHNNNSVLYPSFETTIKNQWNAFCDKHPSLKKIQEVSLTRRKHLKARFEQGSFKDFAQLLSSIEKQPFLIHGNPKSKDHSTWRINFDWLIINDTNHLKVLEMKYVDQNRERFNQFMPD